VGLQEGEDQHVRRVERLRQFVEPFGDLDAGLCRRRFAFHAEQAESMFGRVISSCALESATRASFSVAPRDRSARRSSLRILSRMSGCGVSVFLSSSLNLPV
jgi:hypothetical protein